MKYTRYIAKSFLRSRKGPGKLTGIISTVGMAVGGFAMIVSIAVMNGFESRVTSRLRGMDGDIRIRGAVTDRHVKLINQLDGVYASSPFYERKGLILSGDNQQVVVLKAIIPALGKHVYSWNVISNQTENSSGIYIGKALSYRMNISENDQTKLMSPLDMTLGLGLPNVLTKNVSGIFHSKVLDYDEKVVFIPLEDGKKLFKRLKHYSGIDIKCNLDQSLEGTVIALENIFDDQFSIKTWNEQHSTLVQAMALERMMAMVILSLIILVAGFNLASTLSLVTIQKINEIGILQAIGVPKMAIKHILLYQGMILGGRGTLIGILLGIMLVLSQQLFSFIPLPSDIYFIQTLPMELHTWNLILIPSISFMIIFVSSYIAGQKAIGIEPKTALTWNK